MVTTRGPKPYTRGIQTPVESKASRQCQHIANQLIMNSELKKAPKTRARIKVIIHQIDRENSIRRATLLDRKSGLILETQTLFLDHEYSHEALNTQIAVLTDLTFLYEWISFRFEPFNETTSPEQRARLSKVSLTENEIRDLARWCQLKTRFLTMQAHGKQRNVTTLPIGQVVSPALRNRRLRYISQYLQWITVNFSSISPDDGGSPERTEMLRRKIERSFQKQIIAHGKPVQSRSLDPSDSKKLREVIRNQDVFPLTAHGQRDRIIVELLLQGVRAGELLKTKVEDIDDAYEVQLGKRIGVINITRRINDIDDSRKHEPAVKTRPGILPIPNRVIKELINYITQWRRHAVDQTSSISETPYLFVCHSGPAIGRPMSQRNLNRVIAKLKGLTGLPKNLTPHTLRHTHFTEIYQHARLNGRSDTHIQDMLILRGRWAPNSKMPAKYVHRALMQESADFIEERDQALTPFKK